MSNETKKSELAKIAEALLIMDKYDFKYKFLSAEHDIIYACDVTVVSDEDKQRILDLGWHVDEASESFAKFV